jgi:hypothetical protein
MKKSMGKKLLFAAIAFAMIFGMSFAGAQSAAAAGPDFSFNLSASMADNLSMLKGRTVTIYVASGQTITGTVNEVRGNLLHLVKLSQKDFFDALIAIDRIAAIDTKVRGQ